MMKSNYYEIWPTPIGEYWLDDMSIHSELVELISNKYKSYEGHDTMNLFTEPCRFSDWVHECVKDYTIRINYPMKSSRIQRAWCTTLHPLHDNFMHTHYHVDIAAVYYLDVVPEHPPLEIFDPRPAHSFNSGHRLMADGNIASLNESVIQFPPENFKLLMHPGYLLHGVTHNLTNIARSAVGINIALERDKNIRKIVTRYSVGDSNGN